MSEPFAYDRVHYPARPHHQTRPDHLELLARLFGMTPRPAPEARILEIGCGTAENLLLAAECFPSARFVGIDLSADQIAAGEKLRAAAGLENVDLRAFDLAQIDASFGAFDYIVAHGVYSWVPAAVRESLLEVIKLRLAPQGVAFISHNVWPGAHAKQLARGIMRYRSRAITEAGERAAAGRAALEQVVRLANPNERLYRATVAEQAKLASEREDHILFHDDLAEVCDSTWFWEMAERLGAHDLQFLADANAERLGSAGLSAEALRAAAANAGGDVVALEQELDFLGDRAFRMTLACHAQVALNRPLTPALMPELHVGLDPGVAEIKLDGDAPADPLAVSTQSTQVRITDPLAKGALIALGEVWPGSLPFATLAADTLPNAALAPELAARVLDLFRSGLVALSPRPPTFATRPPARPRASALARLQAGHGGPVMNLRHTYSELDDDERALLPLLDGTRDLAALGGAPAEATLAKLRALALILPS
jgi:SAM-dependent methyltransferase